MTEETNEAVLDLQQRRKRGLVTRRNKNKLKRARERAKRRLAPKKNLDRRARKLARALVRKRFAGAKGGNYNQLSPSEKMQIDRRLDSPDKKKLIDKLAQRLMPQIRRAEQQRLQSFMKGAALKNHGAKEGHRKTNESLNEAFSESFSAAGVPSMAGRVSVGGPTTRNKPRITKDGKQPELKDVGKKKPEKDSIEQFQKFQEDVREKILTALETKAVKTGIDFDILAEVFGRGVEAYPKGVKVTQEQYAFARVNSFVNKGKTYYEEDADLVEEPAGSAASRAGRANSPAFKRAQANAAKLKDQEGKPKPKAEKKAPSGFKATLAAADKRHKAECKKHYDAYKKHKADYKEHSDAYHGIESDHKNYGFASKEHAHGALEELQGMMDRSAEKMEHHLAKAHHHNSRVDRPIKIKEDLDESSIRNTKKFIQRAHDVEGGQKYGGQPYSAHPKQVNRVGKKLFGKKWDDHTKKAALLHDVPEDTPYKREHLAKKGHSKETLDAVDLVTKDETKSYEHNIKRITDSGNHRAMMVKYADNYCNYSAKPKASWSLEKIKKSKKKYMDSMKHIGKHLGVDHHERIHEDVIEEMHRDLIEGEIADDRNKSKPYVRAHRDSKGNHYAWVASNKYGHKKYFGKDFKRSAMKHAGINEANVDKDIEKPEEPRQKEPTKKRKSIQNILRHGKDCKDGGTPTRHQEIVKKIVHEGKGQNSKPKDREIGTDSLLKVYKDETPHAEVQEDAVRTDRVPEVRAAFVKKKPDGTSVTVRAKSILRKSGEKIIDDQEN